MRGHFSFKNQGFSSIQAVAKLVAHVFTLVIQRHSSFNPLRKKGCFVRIFQGVTPLQAIDSMKAHTSPIILQGCCGMVLLG